MAGKRRSATFPSLPEEGDPLSSGYQALTDSYLDHKQITTKEEKFSDSTPLVNVVKDKEEEQPVKKRRHRITPTTKLKYRRRRRSTIHDTFIEPSKNTPHYVKEENSDNLLA